MVASVTGCTSRRRLRRTTDDQRRPGVSLRRTRLSTAASAASPVITSRSWLRDRVYICDECVALCHAILEEELAAPIRNWDAVEDDVLLVEMVRVHASHDRIDDSVDEIVRRLRARGIAGRASASHSALPGNRRGSASRERSSPADLTRVCSTSSFERTALDECPTTLTVQLTTPASGRRLRRCCRQDRVRRLRSSWGGTRAIDGAHARSPRQSFCGIKELAYGGTTRRDKGDMAFPKSIAGLAWANPEIRVGTGSVADNLPEIHDAACS